MSASKATTVSTMVSATILPRSVPGWAGPRAAFCSMVPAAWPLVGGTMRVLWAWELLAATAAPAEAVVTLREVSEGPVGVAAVAAKAD